MTTQLWSQEQEFVNWLIPYKNKDKNLLIYNNNNFKFIVDFDINYISLKKDFNFLYKNLQISFEWLKNYKLSLLYSSSSNFNKIFINNGFTKSNFTFKTKKCDKTNCNICNNFLIDDQKIISGSFILPILDNNKCSDKNLIYNTELI